MDLSIIIVNYNVKFFLQQCLKSVEKALEGLKAEIFVVDNSSVDGSCQMVKAQFPWVKLIESKENLGFSKANNLAIEQAKGKYILLLNPDTVVQEDTFTTCFDFMEKHPKAGSMTVRMIDGKGNYLKESKRGLPTPTVAFYKIVGLATIFPKSKKFARYYLGNLDEKCDNEIEVLPGAYMFIRKQALDKSGALDEDFFMYGEDIDLSYRLILAGYKNYYVPFTSIIHYKGESTKKGSLNYVKVFYQAMIIFARKHFSEKSFRYYFLFIKFAIYLRALLSVVKRLLVETIVPISDLALIYMGLFLFFPMWKSFALDKIYDYPPRFIYIILPLYVIIWVSSSFYLGGYDKPVKIRNIVKGVSIGTFAILLIYALLPLEWRFSRAVIIVGLFWAIVTQVATRWFFQSIGIVSGLLQSKSKKRLAIIAALEEKERICSLLNGLDIQFELVGTVSPEPSTKDPSYICGLNQLKEVVTINKIDEIIFSGNDFKSGQIIATMLQIRDRKLDFKIAPPESSFIIGSNSVDTVGELYSLPENFVAGNIGKRNKRTFDILMALVILFIAPVLIFLIKSPISLFRNIFQVIKGKYTWIGYEMTSLADDNSDNLPKAIISCENLRKANHRLYAKANREIRSYSFLLDLKMLIKYYKFLSD